MADTRRKVNAAPETVNSVKSEGTSSEVMPSQAPGLPEGVNTASVQRSVDPDTSVDKDEDGAAVDPSSPAFDNESQNRTPIQNSIPSGAQLPSGDLSAGAPAVATPETGVKNPEAPRSSDTPEGARVSDPLIPSATDEEARKEQYRKLHEQYSGGQMPEKPTTEDPKPRQQTSKSSGGKTLRHEGKSSDELSGSEKLEAIADSFPTDTPDSHVLFGYGGHRFTVGDLRGAHGQ